jgi:glycosyltransferase involved in cell wall biosynthesis
MLWDKGVGEFVEAARILRREGTTARFQLLGPCGVANPSAIQRSELAAWEQEGVIDYLGETDDVRGQVRDTDCVVLPSYREGVPRTLMEAAAMARPIIASDIPGCREVVRPGTTGLLCQVKDAEALANSMRAFLQLTAGQREAMGEAGRRYALERFDERKAIGKYLAFIERHRIGIRVADRPQ